MFLRHLATILGLAIIICMAKAIHLWKEGIIYESV